MATVSHDHIMSVNFELTTWVFAVAFFAGLVVMMCSFLFQTLTLQRSLPGPIGPAVVILVVSFYLMVEVVLRPSTIAFLIPPP
jgi:hypothetical protein